SSCAFEFALGLQCFASDLYFCLLSTVRRVTFVLFLFLPSALHRNLHSFPTRRSSDLERRHDDSQGRLHFFEEHGRQSSLEKVQRSEEHTSELQSHLNLVCRLLLEKKKLMQGSWR